MCNLASVVRLRSTVLCHYFGFHYFDKINPNDASVTSKKNLTTLESGFKKHIRLKLIVALSGDDDTAIVLKPLNEAVVLYGYSISGVCQTDTSQFSL